MIISEEKQRRSDEATERRRAIGEVPSPRRNPLFPFVASSLRRFVALLILLTAPLAHAADGKLHVYFIDTEGGAATLMVTPAGESVLVDTGNPGQRDPGRIFETTKLAGISKIDHLVITHYHVDHFGGAVDLAKLIPIGTIYDNADENPSRDKPTPEYLAIKCDKKVMPNPGDHMTLKQADGSAKFDIVFLAARKKLIDPPAGAKENPFAKDSQGKPIDLTDNANSIVLLAKLGDFRFFDAGDLTWNVEHDLATPVNRAGTVDVYQVTHHGLNQSNNPVLVKALAPTVAIMNNGTTKGCDAEVCATLKATESIKSVFQLHKCLRPNSESLNTDVKRIANLEKACAGNHVKLTVEPDGSKYTVAIPANSVEEKFETRKHD